MVTTALILIQLPSLCKVHSELHWRPFSTAVTWFGTNCDESSAITSISLGDNLLMGTVPSLT
jgi:hypothetical protein